jgi:transposase
MTKHIHFPLTTAQQRRLLFETWEATGNVTLACRTAHVGRRTFYYWKSRFEEGGYARLEHFASMAPKQPHRTDSTIEEQVVALRQEHPTWGKQRIADELAKANNWVPLVSPNTIKRILRDAGLWHTTPAAQKGAAAQCRASSAQTSQQSGGKLPSTQSPKTTKNATVQISRTSATVSRGARSDSRSFLPAPPSLLSTTVSDHP